MLQSLQGLSSGLKLIVKQNLMDYYTREMLFDETISRCKRESQPVKERFNTIYHCKRMEMEKCYTTTQGHLK